MIGSHIVAGKEGSRIIRFSNFQIKLLLNVKPTTHQISLTTRDFIILAICILHRPPLAFSL